MDSSDKRSAFSMIELMIAVSVLSIGIVLIARSFLTASGALSSCESRIVALNFLEGKMANVEEEAWSGEESLIVPDRSVSINGRTADFRFGSEEINVGEAPGEGEDEEELLVNRITLTVGWREANRSYEEDLQTYVETKKKEQI